MIYLTWGIGYTGIYASQVVGVCNYLNTLQTSKIKLVSFVPYTIYPESRRSIKKVYTNSIIIPMIPSRNHWWPFFAIIFLFISFFHKKIITRGVIANHIALFFKKILRKKWVCYDGRGALKAEWNEFNIVGNQKIKSSISILERKSVLDSDYRIAVSNKLIDYWRIEYKYNLNKHSIIPCTINKEFQTFKLTENILKYNRLKYGYTSEDIIFVYSGSTEAWQSINELDNLLMILLKSNQAIKILFLSKFDLKKLRIYTHYKNRINQKWLPTNKVYELLSIADYGLLYRSKTITNKVAAPTKFAEYLLAGLKIIISDELGDYTYIVKKNNIGCVIKNITDISLKFPKIEYEDKIFMNKFAKQYFSKKSYKSNYLKILK